MDKKMLEAIGRGLESALMDSTSAEQLDAVHRAMLWLDAQPAALVPTEIRNDIKMIAQFVGMVAVNFKGYDSEEAAAARVLAYLAQPAKQWTPIDGEFTFSEHGSYVETFLSTDPDGSSVIWAEGDFEHPIPFKLPTDKRFCQLMEP